MSTQQEPLQIEVRPLPETDSLAATTTTCSIMTKQSRLSCLDEVEIYSSIGVGIVVDLNLRSRSNERDVDAVLVGRSTVYKSPYHM